MGRYRTSTDETLRETAQHGSCGFPFAFYQEDIWQFDFHCIDWHWHHELEFVFVEDGAVVCSVGADQLELRKGCGLFINSGILHRFSSGGSTSIPNIVFSPALLAPEKSLIYEKYIAPVVSASVPYQIFDPHTAWQNQVLLNLSEIFALQEADEKNELRTVRLLLQIWDMLWEHLDPSPVSAVPHHLDHRQARLQAMMQYIHDHYREALTLERIAASASISKSGALHLFQSGIHISPVAYLIQYRLAQAAGLLCATRKTVSSIAEEAGFASPGYFCRKFREHYHMSPNEYRQWKTGPGRPAL